MMFAKYEYENWEGQQPIGTLMKSLQGEFCLPRPYSTPVQEVLELKGSPLLPQGMVTLVALEFPRHSMGGLQIVVLYKDTSSKLLKYHSHADYCSFSVYFINFGHVVYVSFITSLGSFTLESHHPKFQLCSVVICTPSHIHIVFIQLCLLLIMARVRWKLKLIVTHIRLSFQIHYHYNIPSLVVYGIVTS